MTLNQRCVCNDKAEWWDDCAVWAVIVSSLWCQSGFEESCWADQTLVSTFAQHLHTDTNLEICQDVHVTGRMFYWISSIKPYICMYTKKPWSFILEIVFVKFTTFKFVSSASKIVTILIYFLPLGTLDSKLIWGEIWNIPVCGIFSAKYKVLCLLQSCASGFYSILI